MFSRSFRVSVPNSSNASSPVVASSVQLPGSEILHSSSLCTGLWFQVHLRIPMQNPDRFHQHLRQPVHPARLRFTFPWGSNLPCRHPHQTEPLLLQEIGMLKESSPNNRCNGFHTVIHMKATVNVHICCFLMQGSGAKPPQCFRLCPSLITSAAGQSYLPLIPSPKK